MTDLPVTLDPGGVAQHAGRQGDMLARHLRTIEVQRGDYNGACSPSGATT
jgi:hypothetical protein